VVKSSHHYHCSTSASNGDKIYNSSKSSEYSESYTTGDVIGIELDLDKSTLHFFKNNVSQGWHVMCVPL